MKVSIKEVIPDFILPKLSLAIEVKLAKTDMKARTIVDEINADIQAYGRSYDHLLFIVYDLGTIRDTLEFTRDLESVAGVSYCSETLENIEASRIIAVDRILTKRLL